MALTDRQKAFVEFYCGEANFIAVEAARLAGYANPHRMGYEVVKSKAVSEAIQDRLDTRARAAWYSAEDIQKALWEEVRTKEGKGNTQAARVSALVWLGKSIGMWNDVEQKAKLLEEQRKSPQITYNIINYKEALPSREVIEHEVEDNREAVQHQLEHMDDVEIINYSEDNDD